MKTLIIAMMLVFVSGCTFITVSPVDPSLNMTHVCIENNELVIVPGFLLEINREFHAHGVGTEVFYSATAPAHCEYVMTYTALQTWDMTLYLSHAELSIEHKGKEIAHAEYDLAGGGGLSLMKWQSVREKMEPVVAKLLNSTN